MRDFRGPLSADLHRFHGILLVDIGRSVSLMDAARWATWLPPDAVTWLAVREAAKEAEADRADAKKTDHLDALRAFEERRAAELAAMGGE